FDIRKQLLEYDDVSNDQRRTIYQLRNELMDSTDVSARIADLREGVATDVFRTYVPAESVEEQWDIPGLQKALVADLQLDLPVKEWLEKEPDLDDEAVLERIVAKAHEAYKEKVPPGAEESYHQYERYVMLQILDSHWREHLAALDHLRQGIHLRGYAQKNPKQEYKREAFELFGALIEAVKLEVTRTLAAVQIKAETPLEVPDAPAVIENVSYQHADPSGSLESPEESPVDAQAPEADEDKTRPFVRYGQKVGRNDPCPCGSGKKYKQCHGRLA
ncbi:MAG: SEC-C metal-binding domain-containing protein, partial [Betaproteobacteria bacterium]